MTDDRSCASNSDPARRLILGVLAALMVCASASQGAAKPDSARQAIIIRDVVRHHIMPRYDGLAGATAQLASAARGFCAKRGKADIAVLRGRFKRALTAWMGIEHIRFGPVMRKDRHYRFHYWPDKHNQGARQLRRFLRRADGVAPSARDLAEKSVAIQGFPALERVLFTDHAAALPKNQYLCGLMVAITGNLETMARETLSAWRKISRMPPDQRHIASLFRGLIEQLRIIKALKLERPLGKSAKNAHPRRAESWRAGHARENLIANLGALKALFAGERGGRGLRAALDKSGAEGDAAGAIDEAFDFALRFLRSRTLPLNRAVSDLKQRGRYVFMATHIENILELIADNLAPALGVPAGFNALDGD